MLLLVARLELRRGDFAHHAVRAQHAQRFVHLRVVGADDAALDRAHVVGVVEGKVRNQAEGAELPAFERGAMRLADVLDEGHAGLLQALQQAIVERVVAEDMREEDGARLPRDLLQHCVDIHAEGALVDVDEHRIEAALQHRGNIGNPGQGRHDHLAAAAQLAQRRHGDEIRGRSGVDEYAVLDAQPLRPLLLERTHVARLREHRVRALQVLDQRIEVLAHDVVAH